MADSTGKDRPEFSFFVPTSTVIARHPNDPYLVAVIEHAQKHSGRLTLVGGKRSGNTSHAQCAVEEWGQEAGGENATLLNPHLWAVKTDVNADIRVVTLKKASDGFCPAELNDVLVAAHYGYPDYLYVADVQGNPAPKDGEAKSARWIDVRTLSVAATPEESAFGAQHDLILAVYRYYLDGRPVELEDFTDCVALRQKLIAMQQ